MKPWRFLTLSEARALECPPGCHICCDSSLSNGALTWGKLPKHQFRGMNGGKPLIRPLVKKDGKWRVRPWRKRDGGKDAETPFRCAALKNGCSLYESRRPQICSQFPVFASWFDGLNELDIPVRARTGGLTECVWFGVIVVPDSWALLEKRRSNGSLDWHRLRIAEQHLIDATTAGAR